MDENTNQPSTTPLGNERRDNPGQTNIMFNSNGDSIVPTAPSWDENTPLEDIAKQYSGVGGKYNDLVENAADNVGDRQVQLVGNDFGATNPYMFNTYYEPSATAFASEMRQQGTQKALEEGLDRGEQEARNKLSAAQQRYSNALAAAKQREEQRRQAKAHVSETDMSKMPAGTNEREVLNSEAFKNMSEKEREDALTSARIADLQAKQGDKGVTDWNIKNERKTATSATKKKFGITDEQWNGMSKEQKDAFWARQDVGNYWTEQYMIADFKRRGESAGSRMVETFDDIHRDVNTIIQAVKNNTVASLDTHVFETAVPVAISPTEYKFETVKNDIKNSNLEQGRKDEYITVMDKLGKEEFERLIHDYAKKDLILEDSGTLRNKNLGGFGNSDTYTFNGESKAIGFAIKDIYNTFAGNVENLENMSHADWVGSVSYSGTKWYNPTSSLSGSQMADELFNNAFGVDWSSINALTKLEKENPDDYNYLLNQSAYILSSGGAPFGVVEDENTKYFINGKWVSASDEDSPISVGDLVFYSVDGTIKSDGKYNDPELQRFVDLYRKIYNGDVEATEENQKLLNSYYSKYQTALAAAMAVSGRYGMQVDEDVYSAVLSMRDNAEDNKLEFTNPANPNEKITLKDLAEWFNSFSEDEQYNGYTALVNRTRDLKGRYYIYGDSGISSVGTKQNGVDTIGKYGKTEGGSNMKMADQVAKLSDEQCLALNIFLDNKMKNGNIQTDFFDNDEVSLGDGIVNSFWNAVRGTVSFVGWGATSLFGLATGNQDALKAAGGIWDEMTTIDQKDNWAGNGDSVLFNNYTEDVRKMQRSNLNHLIDTTFNLDYFDPSNTYDAATGEVKNSKGEVVAYTDNHYFHKDDWKGFTDNMAGLVGFVGEVLLEGIATAGIGTALRAAKGAFSATRAGQKLATAKNAFSNILTAQASKNGVSQAIKLNQANAFVRRAQDVLGNPTMVNYLVNNTSKLANIGDDIAGMTANVTKISAGAKKAAGAAKASDVVASFSDDVAKIAGKAPDVVDDLTKQAAKGVADSADNIADDITKKTLTEGEEKIASDAMEVVEQYQMLAEKLKPGLDEAASIYKQQFAFDAGLAAVADDIDDAARIASEKIADYFTKQLDNMSFGEMVGKQAVSSALKDVSYDGVRRAAINTALSEATGIASTRLANLSDDTARLLYDVMQTTRGSNIMKTNDIMAYISNRNVYRTGADVASGTIDFKKAAEGVVSASETALNAGKTLDVADALRIIAKNSTEKGELISSLKRSAFWKDRINDYTRDIMQGYYSPHLDEHFESGYTDVVEYMTDPTQLAMGALFDISISGVRKGINSLRLGRINSKLDKLVHSVELDAGAANDSVKISRDLRKMSNLKFKADKLTNNVFDGSISYNKVHDAAVNVENQINAQLDKITEHFDIEKSLNFMSENINNAVKDSGKLDRFKGFTGFGKTKIASATDINRALIRSDDNLKAFIYANDALKSKSVMRFADIVHSSPNIGKLSNQQYQAAFICAWDNTISKTDFAKKFGEANLVKSKDGKYTSTINVANKEKAKELFAQGQELVWNAFYDELAKGKSQLDGVVDFRSLKTELNGIRDRIVAVGNEMIDNGQSVRWNYFPTQGILWSAGDDTPISLVGYYYGASSQEHKSLASNITDPNAERDTIDMSKIVSDLKEGKTEYERKLSFNEKVRAERAGDLSETKLTPYNENGFNPVYAVTAYLNAYDSKKFAASYLDPLKRGNVVIKDNGALNARLTNSKVAKIADVAEYRKALKEKLTKSSKNKIKNSDITDAIRETRASLYDTKIASDRAKIGVARRKLRQTISDSDQFKAITTYMDISSPTNEQIAARIQDRFNTMVSDINSVRKGTSEGLSELYTNTNSVQYRAVIDGLAKNDAVAKDLGNLDGRIINFGKTDLNYDAFNKRYYGVIGIMESTQRAIDNINASKKLSPELTLDELEFMSRQNTVLGGMDNVNTSVTVKQSGNNDLATIKFSHLDDKRPDEMRVVLMDDSKTVNKAKSTDGNILHTMARNKGDGTIEFHPNEFMKHYEDVKSGKSGWNMSDAKQAKAVVAEVSKSPEDMLTWTLLHERGHDAPGGYGTGRKYSGKGGKEAAANNWAYEKFFDKTSPDYIAAHDAAVKILGSVNSTNASAVEVFSGNWTVNDIKAAKDKVFLFGDNIADAKTGYRPTSTQAVIRGEENAIGIPTKKNRGTAAASYFTDADFDEFKAGVDDAIAKAKASGKTIVLPENGIGTGAAQLEKRAPKCFEYLQNQLDALSTSSQSSQPDVSLSDWMFTELNRHYSKPKYDEKTVSAIADKYLDKVTKAQTPDEITKVADEIASDLVPLDPEVKGSSTELKHVTTDIKNAIHWLKETTPKASSQPVKSTTVSVPRYNVEDFVKIREINENSKSQITSIIYNMMLNKYGDKEINGKKTFTSSILKDIINQYAYDAYDNVTLNKTHGEGITAAEVIERFNDVFPNMEMFSDDGYKAIQNVSSKMSSYQSNGGDLNTLKQDIANTLKRANDGEIKLTPEQVRRLAAAYYDLDEATLSSDRITNRGRSELSSDNRVSGDEDGMTFADTFVSEADYGMDPAQRAMEAEAAATPKREGMNLELPSNSDRSIPGKVNNLNYVMDFLARRESDYRTRVRDNKRLWDIYNETIKPNYEAVVNGINAQLKDGKSLKLLKIDRQFEGMSDANWLRITKQLDAGAESIDVAGKTYDRKEIAKIIKNGIDGRGAVTGMDPARLRAYIKNNNIKVTKPMAEALDNLEKVYSGFAKDFLDTSKRRTVSGTSVSPRDAVFNILASNLDPEHKALNFNAGYLMAPSTDDFYINNNNGAFKFPDADGDIAEVRIKYDYGTGSEGTTGTATYWYEKTDSDGNTVRYDSEEELAASLAGNVTADDVRYAMNEAGYNLNVGDNSEVVTDYFYHGNRNTPRGIDNVGPDYEDWQVTNSDRGKPKKHQESKKDIARIDEEIKKLGDVGELTDAERAMYKQITDTKMPYDVLADEYKAVYNKAKSIDRKNSLLAAKSAISAKTATAGTDPMVDFISETVSGNMTKSAIDIENALYGKDGKAGFVDTINELTNDISKRTLNRDAKFHSTFDDLVVKVKSSYDVESKQALMSTLENIKLEYRQKFPGEDTEGIDELVDSLIKVLDEDFKDKNALINAMVENDSVLKAMQEDIDGSADEVVSGKSMININENGPIIVSDDVDITNKISIADLRKARELVTMKKDGKTVLADVSNRRKDKKILKSMREGFTDGYTKKQLVSEASFNKQNAWIDNLVSEIKKSTGNMDIDESKIYINKTVASLGQTFFGEGTAGWQEKMYKVMTSMSNFNKMMQDFHLAGGVGQYNAFTLRNALTMMMQDPIGGARALVTNFKNAKTNQAVISFMIDNSEKLLKYAIDSGDFSAINSFAPLIGMREETVGKGFFTRAVEAAVGTPATIAESQAKLAGFKAAASNIYAEIFNNPTFARWTAVANADLQLRNYNLASRYVDKLVRRYNLTEEDFQRMEGGMGGRDRFVAHLAQLRTEMYWHPQEFFKSGFNAGKYDKVKAAQNEKRTVESLRGMPKKTTAADAFRNFFFAMNYKLQMNMHPIHGFGSIFSSIYQLPRMRGQIGSGRSLNLAASRFAGRGNRNEAAVLIGIAALAHAWNTYIGAPSAWSELWDDNEQSKDSNGIPTGIARSLMNLQDFFKFWMPNTDNGKFDQNQQGTALDPAFSIFTLWNSGARATNALINPNDAHISWERNDLGLQNWQIGDWKVGRGLEGFSDELIGANLLAGYKAIYEVFNNNTYFGNNIWEQPKLPNGEDNPNYDPGRNMMASMAHILNLDGALEGNMWGAGTNRWVKGLDIDSINWEHGEKLATPKSKGLKMGNKGVYQDKTGTVSGSGLIQHEYVTALQAINDGDYFEALSGAMELPFKSRNYASRARTSLNQEVSLALRDAKKEYDATVKNATNEEKDKAYAKFAKKAVDIIHDWSHKYSDVLGKNDELTSAATKILMSFMSDEYNDDTMYAQNMYSKLRQDLKMAMGDEFIFSKQAYEDAIASGMSPEKAAETWNKHLTALQEAQMKEYKARVALEEAGINEGLDTSVFDTTDFMHDKFEADNATISKKIYTEIKGKLDGQIGEFKNFMEMKDYYEEMINNASTTKQKAKLANKYNEYVEGVISPYIEEYGAAVVNSAYWDGDNVMNHFGKYIIIPADKYYNGKSPRSSFLKDELHIGYRDSSALPSDEEIKEELNKVAKALAKGQVSSAASLVDNALLQLRKGALHASPEDRQKLIRMRALLSSRRK